MYYCILHHCARLLTDVGQGKATYGAPGLTGTPEQPHIVAMLLRLRDHFARVPMELHNVSILPAFVNVNLLYGSYIRFMWQRCLSDVACTPCMNSGQGNAPTLSTSHSCCVTPYIKLRMDWIGSPWREQGAILSTQNEHGNQPVVSMTRLVWPSRSSPDRDEHMRGSEYEMAQNPMRMPGFMPGVGASSCFTYSWLFRFGSTFFCRDSGNMSLKCAAPTGTNSRA